MQRNWMDSQHKEMGRMLQQNETAGATRMGGLVQQSGMDSWHKELGRMVQRSWLVQQNQMRGLVQLNEMGWTAITTKWDGWCNHTIPVAASGVQHLTQF